MPYIFLALVLMPLIELVLILKVGSSIGVLATITLILGTAIAGSLMLRQQGLSTLFRARQRIQTGGIPAQEMAEGMMLAFAGALLLTPGFVTDAIGFSLLVPAVRVWLSRQIQSRLQVSMGLAAAQQSARSNGDGIIEGEFSRESPADEQLGARDPYS